MKFPAFLPLALLALPSVARAGDAPAPAAAGPLTIATEVVSTDADPQDKSLRAIVPPTALAFEEAAPASVKAAPPGPGRAVYAELPTPGRRTALAAARGTGDALTLYLDADGDGTFAGDAEICPAIGSPSSGVGGRRTGTVWKWPNLKVGAARVNVAVQERIAGWAGALVAPQGSKDKDGKAVPPTPLDFSERKPEGIEKPPALSGTVLWATGKFLGDDVVVAAARGAGDALSLVVAKAGDGDLSGAKKAEATGDAVRQEKRRIGTRWVVPDVACLGHTATVTVTATEAGLSGSAGPSSTRRGTAKVSGADWILCLADGDFDGAVSGEDDLWWFGPPASVRGLNYANMFEGDSLVRGKTGGCWRLVSVAADGAAVVAPEASPPDAEAWLHRRSERVNAKRWFPVFEAGLADFAAKQHLDLSRPRAAAPPAWRYLRDFESAKAVAAREGKPLLVDFEADWCGWCKRLDFHTYPDREVVERLARFTCVKMNDEFDPGETRTALKKQYGDDWGGIPAVAVFDAAGKPVRFSYLHGKGEKERMEEGDHVGGWLAPAPFVQALDAAYAAWEKASKAGAPPPAGK